MAQKLQTTLPRNFQEVVDSGDLEAMKKAFEGRSLEAVNRYGGTALHILSVPTALKTWLLEQGADINVRNSMGDTPLHSHVRDWDADPTFITYLLEHGADVHAVNKEGQNVAYAAGMDIEKLRLLINVGADPHRPDNTGQTLLLRVLCRGSSGQIVEMAELLRLLDIAPFTQAELQKVRANIINVGARFADLRAVYDEELVEQASADMVFLYDTFGIPEDKRAETPVRHDGHSPIELEGDDWDECFTNAWDFLVPPAARALSLQGEAIRIGGRVANEFKGNGGTNWDADFARMASALLGITARGVPLTPEETVELEAAVKEVRGGDPSDAAVDVLPHLAVIWVSRNPQPLPLPEQAGYKR